MQETAAVILVVAAVVLVVAVVLSCTVVLLAVFGVPAVGRSRGDRKQMRDEISDISARVTAIQRLLEDSIE